MSNTHWKSTMVARMDLAQVLAPLLALAKERDKVITVFDLEATTFRGRPNFGITELGMLHINPKGQIATAGGFVNPEHRISADAKKLTGITDDMVKDARNWGDGWGEAWSLIAKEHLVIGYNSGSFDAPAIVSEHQRYGRPGLVIADHLDAFKMHKKAHDTKSGKLADVAAWLGIDTKNFEGHRATNDAIMTALVMSALWERFPKFRHAGIVMPDGSSAKAAKPSSHVRPAVANPVGSYRRGAAAPAPTLQPITPTAIARTATPKSTAPSAAKLNIAEHVVPYFANKNTFGANDLVAIAALVAPDHPEPTKLHQAISFEVSRCLDRQSIGMLEPENVQKKELLKSATLAPDLQRMWSTAPRLAPIFEFVRDAIPDLDDLNYIDVRWMLDFHGVRPVGAPAASGPSM